MFEMVGGGERAGSGADTIKKGWADNKWPVLEIKEHFGQNDNRVELTLRLVQSTSSPGKGTENSKNQGKTRVKFLNSSLEDHNQSGVGYSWSFLQGPFDEVRVYYYTDPVEIKFELPAVKK